MICPTFKYDDPNLEKKIKECLRKGSGYGIDYRKEDK